MDIIPYERTAFYYETDQMGIIHHANYIRWFEEARVHFLAQVGFPYKKMEELGVLIPVLGASCEYKVSVKFDETVIINLKVDEFNGFKMTVSYIVTGKENGELKAIGTTKHCFVNAEMKPIRTKRDFPDIYRVFNDYKLLCDAEKAQNN